MTKKNANAVGLAARHSLTGRSKAESSRICWPSIDYRQSLGLRPQLCIATCSYCG